MKTVVDQNTPEYVNNLRQTIFEQIKQVDISPCVPFHNLPSVVTPWNMRTEPIDQEDDPFLF